MVGIVKYCPAWDKVYNREELCNISMKSKNLLHKLKLVVLEVDNELANLTEEERKQEICKRLNMQNFFGNPLFMKSIDACREEKQASKSYYYKKTGLI